MCDVCLDADGSEVGVSDGDCAAAFVVLLAVVDAEDAHDDASRAGDDAVCEVSIRADEDVAGEFADGDIVVGFLQFYYLLIDELRFLVDDKVWIERAFVAV